MSDDLSRTGAGYSTPETIAYLERLHVAHDEGLEAAYRADRLHELPAIQLAASEARTVHLLLRMIGARRAVELGTLAGYSAIHIARALAPGGHLYTVESEPLHARIARDNLALAGLADRVTVLEGKALDVLPSLEAHGPFDAVFIDADKGNYDRYGRWAREHLRPGGLLLGDNAYFFGNLMADTPEAQAMRRFHEEAAAAFESVCVPTPDGLLVGIRR